MIPRAMPAGTPAPDRFSHWSRGRDLAKDGPLSSRLWLGTGPISPHCKNHADYRKPRGLMNHVA